VKECSARRSTLDEMGEPPDEGESEVLFGALVSDVWKGRRTFEV